MSMSLAQKNDQSPHQMKPAGDALVCPENAGNVAMLPFSPGQKLRAAREQAGLTRVEIADKLFLHVGFVTHLENDAFDQLPGATFVKGYIKSYCRVLGIKSEPLIALFNELDVDMKPSGAGGSCAPGAARGNRPSSRCGCRRRGRARPPQRGAFA